MKIKVKAIKAPSGKPAGLKVELFTRDKVFSIRFGLYLKSYSLNDF